MADKKETKKEKGNRFTYESDLGLSIVSKGDKIKEEPKEKDEKNKDKK